MSAQIAAMLIGLLLVSSASLWGLNGLHQDYAVALDSYEELREVYGVVGSRLYAAMELLRANPDDRERAAEQLYIALQRFDLFFSSGLLSSENLTADDQAKWMLRGAITAALAQLRLPPQALPRELLERADLQAVANAQTQMREFSTQIKGLIEDRQRAANKKHHDTVIAVSAICAAIVAGAVLLGVAQYRSVILPLQRLMAGVRKVAAGQFQQRLDERGSQEFTELGAEFNRMAAELDEFYHRLEQKVADKSKELIRSERLASVGYLAAGVAHEINNPLSIIAGYAEHSLSQLAQDSRLPDRDDLEKSLHVICDESFRCKDIIAKLLSLARPGEANRLAVDLGNVAREVVSAIAPLRDYHDRTLTVLAGDGKQDLTVHAVEAEMRQIVLNLTINALEAVSPGGQVSVSVARDNGWVELRVRDNGRGMTPQVLEKVFEPFFTEKRGARQPGTGLGLSITHAIVESHGGRIRASSPGPGSGSEFLVQLPASQASAS